MADNIFHLIGEFEKRAEAMVTSARMRAAQTREEIEKKLKELSEELERRGVKREDIEREIEKRRRELFGELERRMRDALLKLDTARREHLQPIIDEMIKELISGTRGGPSEKKQPD